MNAQKAYLAAVLALMLALPATGLARDFYVSPDGDDSAPGTRERPYASLQRAQKAVREAPQRGEERITVQLRGGVYVLDEPLVFTPQDSGSDGAPVVYAAASGEQPIISGGTKIDGWEADKWQGTDCWTTQLPRVKEGEWYFRELFVNGDRRQRPRVPEEGYHRFAGATESASNWRGHPKSAKFHEGDLAAWENLSDVEMVILNRWVDAHDRLARVDEEENIVHFDPQAYQNIKDSKGKWARYYVVNVKEALDSPGEWYLDRDTGILRYIPVRSEEPEETVAWAPRLKTVLRTEPGSDGQSVHHVQFQNLSFRHATPEVEQNPRQSASTVPGCVVLEGAEDCVFYGCDFAHLGGYALEVGKGSAENRVVACTFRDTGAGGVRLSNGSKGTWVTDCNIRSGGRIWRSATGVFIQDSGWNRILHNNIFDFYYSGITLGWTWGYTHTRTVDNRINDNHIHTIGQGVLSDMGAIYMLGTQPGTVLRNNHIHDVESYSYGGWGIYTDQGSSFILAEDNVVYRTTKGGFHQHYGRANTLTNNVFALSRDYEVKHSRPQHVRSFIFTHNIVYPAAEADMLHGRWGRKDYTMHSNLYWCENDSAPSFDGEDLEGWRSGERGKDSVVAPPLFGDPDGGDYSLRSDSAAHGIGFEPIDLSDVGPRRTGERPVDYEDWSKREAPEKVILEPRLETVWVRENRKPQEPYFQPMKVEAGEPCEIYYRVRNRGKLPAQGSVRFRLQPTDAAELEGEREVDYDLQPGEEMQMTFNVIMEEGASEVMVEAVGNDAGLPDMAVYLTEK